MTSNTYRYSQEVSNALVFFDLLKNKSVENAAHEIYENCNMNLSIVDIKKCIEKYNDIQNEILKEKINKEKLLQNHRFRLEKNINKDIYFICIDNINTNRRDRWSKHQLCSSNSKNSKEEQDLIKLFFTFPNKKIRNKLVTDFIGKVNIKTFNSNLKDKNFKGIYKVVSYTIGF